MCLRTEDAYELLSTYPTGGDLWALSAVDVTELREAEQALRRQEEGIRRAYVDVLDAVTGGKLILLTEEELAAELGEPLGDAVTFGAPGSSRTRAARWSAPPSSAIRGSSVTPTCSAPSARRSTTPSSTPRGAPTRSSPRVTACR